MISAEPIVQKMTTETGMQAEEIVVDALCSQPPVAEVLPKARQLPTDASI